MVLEVQVFTVHRLDVPDAGRVLAPEVAVHLLLRIILQCSQSPSKLPAGAKGQRIMPNVCFASSCSADASTQKSLSGPKAKSWPCHKHSCTIEMSWMLVVYLRLR